MIHKVCDDSPSIFSCLITFCSLLLILITLPVSLFFTVKVVQVTIVGNKMNKSLPTY